MQTWQDPSCCPARRSPGCRRCPRLRLRCDDHLLQSHHQPQDHLYIVANDLTKSLQKSSSLANVIHTLFGWGGVFTGGFPEPIPSLAMLSLPACMWWRVSWRSLWRNYYRYCYDKTILFLYSIKVTFSQSKGSDSRTCRGLYENAAGFYRAQ